MRVRVLIQVAAMRQEDFYPLSLSSDHIFEMATDIINEEKTIPLKKKWKLCDGSTHLIEFEKIVDKE